MRNMKYVRYPELDDSVLAKFKEMADRINDLIAEVQELNHEVEQLRKSKNQ